jgi:hypothetical protein
MFRSHIAEECGIKTKDGFVLTIVFFLASLYFNNHLASCRVKMQCSIAMEGPAFRLLSNQQLDPMLRGRRQVTNTI